MHTKNNFVLKITAILLVIFLTFGNVAQVSAFFAGTGSEREIQMIQPQESGINASIWDGNYPATRPAGMDDGDGDLIIDIDTAEEFAWIMSQPNMFLDGVTGVHTVRLNTNIDLANHPWTPSVAAGPSQANTFDGGGYTISNLFVDGGTYQSSNNRYFLGLFGRVPNAAHAKIQNLTVDGAVLKGSTTVRSYAGVITGSEDWMGHYENVHVKNATITASKYVGAIAAYGTSNMTNVSAENITFNITEIGDDKPHVGGLIGLNNAGTLDNATVSNVTINISSDDGIIETNQVGAQIGTAQANVVINPNSTATDVTYNGAPLTALVGLDNRVDTRWYDPAGDNYVITTIPELKGFDNLLNAGTSFLGKTVLLGADIDLAGQAFLPLGSSTNIFKGTFDGQNHTLSNLSLTQATSRAGFFARIDEGGVKNLYVDNFDIEAPEYTGAVAGQMFRASIDNVHVSNSTILSDHYGGGVTGHLYGNAKNSSVTEVEVLAQNELPGELGNKLGGLAGYVGEGNYVLENNTGTNVTVTGIRDVGGLFGTTNANNKVYNNTITDSTVTASDEHGTETNAWAGGIVGRLNGASTTFRGNVNDNTSVTSYGVGQAGPIYGGPAANAIDQRVHNETQDIWYKTITEAVNAAVAGDVLHVANGIYPEYLIITKDIQIVGESRDGVIIDASSFGGYGIDANGDFVTSFENFTLIGPGSAQGYGFKIAGENAETTISNVLVKDSFRTGLDLNGLNKAVITDVELVNNGGNGLSLTNSSNVTVTNITTSGNTWGGVAVYTDSTTFSQGADNISIVGTNSFGEPIGFYTEIDPDYPPTNLNLPDFHFTVVNETDRLNFMFYATDQANAVQIANGMPHPEDSSIRSLDTSDILVFPGMSIQAAVDAANPGDTILVAAGTYVENVDSGDRIINGLTVQGVPAANGDYPLVKGSMKFGIQRAADYGSYEHKNLVLENFRIEANLTDTLAYGSYRHALMVSNFENALLRNLQLVGTEPGNMTAVTYGITVDVRAKDYTIDNVTIENFELGVYGRADNLTIQNSEISHIQSGVNIMSGENLVITDSSVVIEVTDKNRDFYVVRFAENGGPFFGTGLNISNSTLEITNPNNYGPWEGKYMRSLVLRAQAGGELDISNSNIPQGILNNSTVAIEATGNWWGSAEQPVANVDYVGLVHLCGWLDGPAPDGQMISGGVVTNERTSQTYCYIQEAVDEAIDNDVLLVGPGTYYENVYTGDNRIVKGLTVRGIADANGDYPLVIGSMKFGRDRSLGGDYAQKNLVLENFRIEANLTDTALYGSYRHALWVENFENAQLRNLELVGTEPNSMFAIQYGLSVGGRAKDYTIDNVTMDNFLIGVYGRALNMTIQNSDISHVEAGMNIMGGGNLTITDSSIVTEVTRNDKQLYAVRFGEGNSTGSPSVLGFHVNNSTLALNNPDNLVPSEGNYMRSVVLRGNAGGDLVVNNSNIPQGILNIASVSVDASGNWWGSADKPVVDEDYVGLVNFCGWLNDEAPDGELISDSGFVTNQNTSKVYCSVQSAIDAATAGDTLLVGPGTYAEQIVINKAITLQGPNADKAGYATDRVAEAIVTFPEGITAQAQRLVNVTASDVSIVGLKFEYGEHMLNLLPYMIRTSGVDNLTVKNNIIYGGEAGIHAAPVGTVNNTGLLVEGNFIDGGPFVNSRYNRGMYIYRMGGLIQNNVIDHVSIGIQFLPHREPTGLTAQYNDIKAYSIGLYNNNQYAGSGPHKWIANTVGVAENPRGTAEMGVYLPYTTDVTFRGIHVINHGLYGGTGEPPLAEFYNNILDGTYDPATTVGMASTTAVRISSANPDSNEGPSVPGTKTIVYNNAFDNFDTYINNTTTVNIDPNLLDASGNWWGTTDAAALFAGVTAGSDYTPWLASGIDNDADVAGFQGDFSTLYVDDDSFQVGTVGRIQEAIDLVSGSTIYVLPGTYQEAVVVDKAVNLYGPNMDVDPNGTVARGAEAIILGSTTAPAMSTLFELDAENVVVKGFTFDNVRINNYIDGGATGTLTNQFGGVDISNNIFTNVSGTAVYLRDGRNAPGEYSADVTVKNNLFNAISSAGGVDYNAGSAVVVMGAENLLVDGNVIEDAAYNGIQLARNNNVIVSNNTAVAAQPAIQIAQWNEGTQTISGNDWQTTHASKAAMRFYAFTTDRTPSFVIENNEIHDSVNGIQIGHGDAGKGDDISTADYSFAGNTFTDISSHELVVYLPAEATTDQMTEMVEDFRQVYDDSVYVREINGVDPYTYVVDTAPVAVDDAYTTKEDTELVVSAGDGVLANDTDAEGDPLTAVLVTGPVHITENGFTLNADGSFSYMPDLDYFGEDTFTYKVVSGETTSNIATVTITVTPEKDQVIANPDFYAVDEDSVLTVSVEDGVLANDEDVDLNHRQATLVESVKYGTLTLNADGSFVYTPEANFHGEDTFTYRLVTYPRINEENPWIDEALVTITVNPILDPPALSTDMPDSVMTGVEYQYGVTLDNPDYGDEFAGVRVLFTLSDTDLADIASLKYYEVQDGTWKDLPLTQDGANVTGWFGPAAGFPMTAPYNATSQFKLTMAVGSAGTYAYEMDLYDVVADPDMLLTSLTGSLEVIESPVVTIQDFYYASSFTMKGVSADIRLDHGTTDDAASIVVELFAGEPGAYQLLQTNTANLEKFNAFTVFTSPFDIFGTRNYVGSSWSNVREAEYGQTLTPTRVLATITLLNGDVISDEELILTGDSSMIQPSVVAEDFGYGRWSGILGVNAGFHTVNFTLGQAVDVKVELFTGEAGAYELLQTNTWIADNPAWDGMSVYSAPFDIFGTFDYAADGFWTNVREAEYGQTAIPTRVLTTITLPGGVVVTAENTNLTGDRAIILSSLDEEIKEAANYVYDPVYEYTGDLVFDDASNTYAMTYWPAEYLDGAPMRDLARYLGALHYQDISTVESLTYKGVVYTWDAEGTLVGSNWKNGNVTLVSVIVADLLGVIPGTVTVTLSDGYYTEDVTFVVDVYNTLDAEIASAPDYEYDPVYNYVGTFTFEDESNTYTATYTDDNYAPGALYDLARYLGALHRQAGATVIKVTYKGVDYTWNPVEPLKGSNWEDADGTTLVSVVSADFQAGLIDPDVTFTVADGIHTETVTFIIVIEDTTAPEIVSITAIGSEGFDDVLAVGGVITVDQGYTVEKTEIELNEAVMVEAGTVVSIGGQPYGSITAEGSVLTVVPFGSNGIASIPGTFELSIPAGSVKDLAGNALQDTVVTLTVNNVAPVANDDAYTTPEDTLLMIAAPGVLANDVDWTPLTITLVDNVDNGTLTLNADGSFSYQPDEDWHGEDSFTYNVSDGELESGVATVTITVTPEKDQVRAVDDFYSVNENAVLNIAAPGVMSNDLDPDGNQRRVVLVTDVAHGILKLNADGSFVYTPEADWSGEDSFVYELVTYPGTQSLWTDEATVTITVIPLPVISSDDIGGPYMVGELREFNVTLTNPAEGASYTSMSASVFVDNIGLDDFETVEVYHPVYHTWVPLEPVVDGTGLRLDLGPTANFPLLPGQSYILTFRVNFNTPGSYPAVGSLYDASGATPVEIASFNATLTVNHVNTLDEQIRTAPDYVYDPVYEYVGDMSFDDESNTYTMVYWPAEYLAGQPAKDLARYLGALYRQAGATINKIRYEGVDYTWNPAEPLKGSNWEDANGVTLVSVIVADLLGQFPGTATVTVADSLYTENVTFVVDVYNTLDAEIASAPDYEYDPVYNYVGTFTFEDETNTYTATYTDDNYAPGALYDLARYLGALHRQAGATVIKVTYKGVDYTWNPAEPLKGSNWEDANGVTLVSVVGADFQAGLIDPDVTFTVADGIHTETVTFIIVIEDTTAPEIVSITAIGSEGFDDVLAVGGVITVDQGYTVEKTEIELNEAVTVEAGTVVSIDGRAYGTITAEGTKLTVVPYAGNETASQPGTFAFSVPAGSVKDLAGNALVQLGATLVVNNVAPVAVADEYTTEEDIELVVATPGVLANDVDWTPLTVELVSDVSNGTLTLNADGSFSYQPDEDWHGEDSFTYKVSDGELESEVATVTITVTDVKDQVIAEDDEYETDEDVILTVNAEDGVLSNDIDPDGNEQRAVLKTDVQHGQLTLNPDGSFEYIPDTDWFGEDSFIYELVTFPRTQSLWTDEATVTITVHPVNDAPVLNEIDDVTIPEMAPYTFTAIATDVDSTNLTFSLVNAPVGASINAATGVFKWTPTELQGPGVYTFTVKVCDDAEPVLCDEQSLTITVEEVNLAPRLYPVMDDEYTIDEETELTVTFPAVDDDLPAQTLTFALVDAPEGATINPVTGIFAWTPTEAQGPGVYEFTVTVCDNGEPVLCDEQLITVTVEEVNLPPVLAEIGDKEVVAEEELTFTATATDPDLPVQTLSFSLVGAPAGASIDSATGVFTWTPTVDQAGDHTVTICVSDGELEDCEEITITVTEPVVINLPPVAVADAYTTNEDVVLTVAAPGVLENDSDPNGDPITAILVDGVEHGTLTFNADGSFVYTPEQDYNGTDSFTYKAFDGELESEVVTVTITINPVNDAPVAVDDAYTTAEDTALVVAAPGVLANDYDIDGDTLNATLRTDVSHGSLTLMSDGSFTYLPDPNFFGTDSFTYTLISHPQTDSGWTDWATVTITITPVNDAPVLVEIPDATIPEMVLYSFTATATDVDSTNLTFSLINPPVGATINATTGVFTWTPSEEQGPDEYTFTVKVCDDGTPSMCDQQAVTLTVLEVNIAPELDPIEDQEVEVGEELTFTVTASDADLPVQTLTFYLNGAPAGASINATTGVFTWTPVESQIGEHRFEICVSDGELEDCQEITVTVIQGYVNTAPVAVADAYEVEYESVLSIAAPGVLANDSDADDDELIAILVSPTANGTLTFNADGSFKYVPNAGFSGTDTFTYKANDGELDSNVVTVTITVHAAPAPVYRIFFPIIRR